METKEFLKRYAWVYLYVAAFFLGCAALLRHTVETVGTMQPFSSTISGTMAKREFPPIQRKE